MVHTFYNFVQTITVSSNDFYNIRRINPNGAVGHTVPAVFFRWLFLLGKRGLEVRNFLTFLDSL